MRRLAIPALVALVATSAACRRKAARTGEHIAAGLNSTCTLDAEGIPDCWGPTIRQARLPPIGAKLTSLRAAHNHACGITTDRRVTCFGDCGNGVRPGTFCDAPPGNFDEVGVGFEGEACALAYPSTLRCWGFMAPWRSPPPGGERLHGLVVGERYACVLDAEGHVRCWGDRDPALPAPPPGPGFRAIAAARYQACALDASSEIVCWGLGENKPPRGKFVRIAANWEQFCALDEAGTARCWGLVKGYERRGERHGRDLREIAVGQNHACGLHRGGEVECWGEVNDRGEGILPRNGQPLPPLRDAVPATEPDAGTTDGGLRHRPSTPIALLPTDEPPDEPLSVLVDGKALPIKDAIASTAGEEGINVVLSTHPLTCAAASRGWQEPRSGKEPESRVLITLASLVAEPDGDGRFVPTQPSRLRVAHSAWSHGASHGLETRAGGVAAIGAHAAERGRSDRLRVAYDAHFGPKDGSWGSSIELRGALTVRGCGVLPPEGVARPQPDVEVEIAGVRVPMRGAVLVDGDRALRLTSGPAACPRGAAYDAPWDYQVGFRSEPSKQLEVSGAKLYAQHMVVDPKIVFDVLPSTRPGEVDVRVDDGGREHALSVRVRGTVHALRCSR
jgi:hypothetical protein